MDSAWVKKFISLWNDSEHRIYLSNLGVVKFEVHDEPRFIFMIHWKENGTAVLADDQTQFDYRLGASRRTWLAFFGGAFGAAQGVIDGHLSFDGDFRAIAPFAENFNRVAAVASCID
jgi:putative sterol carrier protein